MTLLFLYLYQIVQFVVCSLHNYLLVAICLWYPFDKNVRAVMCRRLSREDIMVVAGSGCPSTDRKVVNSGKRLRAHVELNEGNVCIECTF